MVKGGESIGKNVRRSMSALENVFAGSDDGEIAENEEKNRKRIEKNT